jgi:anti-sigma factor RsiW
MNCRKARECIQLQLDGELSRHDAIELAGHLAACPDCRTARRQFLAISGALSEISVLTGGSAASLIPAIRSRPLAWRGWFAAAAAIAIALTGWLMMHQSVRTPHAIIVVKRSDTNGQIITPTSPNAAQAVAVAPVADTVRVNFSQDSNVLAVPVQTRNPNITILRLYPKIQLASSRDPAREQGS